MVLAVTTFPVGLLLSSTDRGGPNIIILRRGAQPQHGIKSLPATAHETYLLQPELGDDAQGLMLAYLRPPYKHASSPVSPFLLQPTLPFR